MTTCPTCGGACTVGGEGLTHYFVPACGGERNEDDMKIWIVGKSLGSKDKWEFQGVFSSEAKALAACKAWEYFMAPVLMNEELPYGSIDWDGLRWPVANRKTVDAPA